MKKPLLIPILLLSGCADTYVKGEFEAEFFEKIEFCRENGMQIVMYDVPVTFRPNPITRVECEFKTNQ